MLRKKNPVNVEHIQKLSICSAIWAVIRKLQSVQKRLLLHGNFLKLHYSSWHDAIITWINIPAEFRFASRILLDYSIIDNSLWRIIFLLDQTFTYSIADLALVKISITGNKKSVKKKRSIFIYSKYILFLLDKSL